MARLAVVGVLIALLVACGGDDGDDGGETGAVELEFVVVTGPEPPARFEVRCGPVGGTTPDPEATCTALAEHPEMLAPPAMTASCVGNLGTPPEIRVVGTAGGKPVEVSVRECDEPEARAESARLWLDAAGLGG